MSAQLPSAGPRRPSEAAGRFAAVAFAALLLIPTRDLVDSHPSAVRLACVLAGLAAFAVVFLWPLAFGKAARPWPWIAVALVLAVALVVGDGPERWAPLFIFLSAMVGVRLPLPAAAFGIAGCAVAAAAVLLPTAPFDNTLAVTLQTLGLGGLTVGMGRLRVTIAELQEAREQLARLAVTEERLRFARDLHDLLGHSLSLIALKADLAGRVLGSDRERASREVADIERVAREALAEVRQTVTGYRQPTLAAAVASGRMALEAAGIDGDWDVAQVALGDEVDVVLGWAVREAVTNVVRHSGARRCSVRVTAGLAEAAAEVVDDGVGGGDGGTGAGDGGNGLAGLGERVRALGGRLEVVSPAGGGFRVRASVPR